ncbi:ATPase WRNIP1-like [Vespa crabro]|uniref:ATPase WRNIP1-like n=1 Tax=Vespa crabro TaxID=7445 RepID=UPI001F0273FE|nr:ATPase WRNIP1-like [Vespa crabro]XP_046835627.1 ATPase WRNIP1-like [Vespa crabro]XP_046835628.1 ATPase WRNIP1-like [Vespa crabro]
MNINEQVSCPICQIDFPSSLIQSHVTKCLFLIDSNTAGISKESSQSPGSKSLKSKSFPMKKPDNKITKRKISSGQTFLITKGDSTQQDLETKETINNPAKKSRINERIPLAERMRPSSFSGYVGQEHILGPRCALFQLLHKGEIPNMILWGPPGCGKTSLANVIAHICKNNTTNKMRYVKLSAAMAGVNDLKEVINIAANELKFGRRTVVFMDEIHRFNKTQQDVFLPHVESGTITLIGATTENPSYNLNSALLSRCRVVLLEKLSTSNLVSILKCALSSLGGIIQISSESKSITNLSSGIISEACGSGTLSIPRFIVDEATIQWLAETCDGDARIALGGLELAVLSKMPSKEEYLETDPVLITLNDIKENLRKTHMLYDKKGDQHYDMISALHKSVRASDENASLYWLTRMIAGGEDPVYIARRLVRMACEDVGLEDPKALSIAVNTMNGCKMIGMPECDVLLAQCTIYLARAPKSRLMEDALRAAQSIVANHKGPQPGVPLHLRNGQTKTLKNLGYGKGYNMLHKDESGLNYLPEGLENVDFFMKNEDIKF